MSGNFPPKGLFKFLGPLLIIQHGIFHGIKGTAINQHIVFIVFLQTIYN
jgi:hypothetical protein